MAEAHRCAGEQGLHVAADIAYLQAYSVGGERRDENTGMRRKRRRLRERGGGANGGLETRTLQSEKGGCNG